ncbi:MAG: MHS family MFS transporter [Verrucomicrobia bacterium]|nr:MHS family MFS transporter [Verrucomicrobiota bacterium]
MSTPVFSASELTQGELQAKQRLVIIASSLGTVFEWYDFYIYGSLAVFFAGLFFPPGNPVTALLTSLLTFGVGFVVRPFGALFFGRIGDLVGRKYTFLITITVMGLSTALVGVLPTFAAIGWIAPIILFLLRVTQGLALGGEYGGAATYVAEHAPHGKRGLYTSWIQTTATLGLFLSLAVIFICRHWLSADDFKAWGWRIPFLLSVVLLGVSIYIRLKLQESPLFTEMKAQGKGSRAPLRDSFVKLPNAKYVFLALFGATAGQGVVWYTGQFHALFFLQGALSLKDYTTAYELIAISLLIGTPFFIFFGWLSDRVGRKAIIMAGCLLAALTYFPLFHQLTRAVNPALATAMNNSPIVVSGADGPDLDKVKADLNARGYSFAVRPPEGGSGLKISIGSKQLQGYDAKALGAALASAEYPKVADPAKVNFPAAILTLFILVLYVTMVYGPIAAFLVELFPTEIRYTSMSFPYHIGNGIFGGLLPFIAASVSFATGNIYAGLWYPIIVALVTFAVGVLFVPETKDRDLRT